MKIRMDDVWVVTLEGGHETKKQVYIEEEWEFLHKKPWAVDWVYQKACYIINCIHPKYPKGGIPIKRIPLENSLG